MPLFGLDRNPPFYNLLHTVLFRSIFFLCSPLLSCSDSDGWYLSQKYDVLEMTIFRYEVSRIELPDLMPLQCVRMLHGVMNNEDWVWTNKDLSINNFGAGLLIDCASRNPIGTKLVWRTKSTLTSSAKSTDASRLSLDKYKVYLTSSSFCFHSEQQKGT